jgi:hypothetical protein
VPFRYPGSVSTTPTGTPCSIACRICSRAISGLVRNTTSSGTPACRQRLSSWHHTSGKYKRHAIGKLELQVLTDKLIAVWQLSDLPNSPQYCWATPTECFPCFGKPVSSMIHATTESRFCMSGNTSRRTCASISWSFHGASATKWWSD